MSFGEILRRLSAHCRGAGALAPQRPQLVPELRQGRGAALGGLRRSELAPSRRVEFEWRRLARKPRVVELRSALRLVALRRWMGQTLLVAVHPSSTTFYWLILLAWSRLGQVHLLVNSESAREIPGLSRWHAYSDDLMAKVR